MYKSEVWLTFEKFVNISTHSKKIIGYIKVLVHTVYNIYIYTIYTIEWSCISIISVIRVCFSYCASDSGGYYLRVRGILLSATFCVPRAHYYILAD